MSIALGTIFADVRLSLKDLQGDAEKAKGVIAGVTSGTKKDAGAKPASALEEMGTAFTDFRDKLANLGGDIAGALGSVGEKTQATLDGMGAAFVGLRKRFAESMDPITERLKPVGDAFESLRDRATTALSSLWDDALSPLRGQFSATAEDIKTRWEATTAFVVEHTQGMRDGISDSVDFIGGRFKAFANQMEVVKDRVSEGVTAVTDRFSAFKDKVASVASTVGEKVTAVKDGFEKATSAIHTAFTKVSETAKSGASVVGHAFDVMKERAQKMAGPVTGALKGVGGGFQGLIDSGAKLGVIGLAAGAAIGGVVAVIGDLVAAGTEGEQTQAQLNAVLVSTHGIAGMTANSVNDLADSLQKTSTYSHNAIVATQDVLLTFTNVGKTVFPQATSAILDLSTSMKIPLKNAAILVGKALNDPIKGMSALQRVGVTLSQHQKDLVKHFMAVGDAASAQKIIIGELHTEFGGSAAAAASTFGGKLEQLKNKLEETKEKIGSAVIPVLSNMLQGVMPLISAIGDHLPAALDLVTDFFSTRLLPAITTVFNFIKNDAVPTIINMAMWFKTNILPILIAVGGAIKQSLGEAMKSAQGAFKEAHPQIQQFQHALVQARPILEAIAKVIGLVIVTAIGVVIGVIRGLMGAFKGIIEVITGVINVFRGVFDIIMGFVTLITTGNGGQLKRGVGELWNGVIGIFKGAFDAILGFVSGFIGGIIGWFQHLFEKLIGHSIVTDLIKGILNLFFSLPTKILGMLGGFVGNVLGGFAHMEIGAITHVGKMALGAIQGVAKMNIPVVSGVAQMGLKVISHTADMAKNVMNLFDLQKRHAADATAIQRDTAALHTLQQKELVVQHMTNQHILALKEASNQRKEIVEQLKNCKNESERHALEQKLAVVNQHILMERQAVAKAVEMHKNITDKMKALKDDATKHTQDMHKNVLDNLADLPQKMLDLGGQIVSGLANGIMGAIGTAKAAIGNVGQSILSGIKGMFGIHSPSSVMHDLAQHGIMAGLANGIAAGSGSAQQAMLTASSGINGAALSGALNVPGGGNGSTGAASGVTIQGDIHITVEVETDPGDDEQDPQQAGEQFGRGIGMAFMQTLNQRGHS